MNEILRTHRQIHLNNGKSLMVREVRKKDAVPLSDYIGIVCRETEYLTFGPDEVSITGERQEAFIDTSYMSPTHLMLIGVIDGVVIGNLNFSPGIRPRTSHRGEFGISVLKKYWRKGVGSFLLGAFIQWAEDSRQIRKINLRVRSDNEAAIKLYSKFGFQIEGRLKMEYKVSGRFYDAFFMGLVV